MMAPTLNPQSFRDVYRASAKMWVQSEDESEQFKNAFAEWLKNISENEMLCKQHVYDNPNLCESDLRQHRMRLFALLHDGEAIGMAVDCGIRNGKLQDFGPTLILLDQKLKELFRVLLQWHGPLETQSDIPESYKQAVRESEENNVADLDI